MKNPKLPAGIEDEQLEIYVHDGEPKVVYHGSIHHFNDLPSVIKHPFEIDFIEDIEGRKLLDHELGIVDPEEQFLKRIMCLYGGFDKRADRVGNVEFWNCGEWKSCPIFGKFCKVPAKLSARELELACYVVEGLQDIEICDKMNISQSTCTTYHSRIREKIHVNNRVEIAKWVRDNILI